MRCTPFFLRVEVVRGRFRGRLALICSRVRLREPGLRVFWVVSGCLHTGFARFPAARTSGGPEVSSVKGKRRVKLGALTSERIRRWVLALTLLRASAIIIPSASPTRAVILGLPLGLAADGVALEAEAIV